MTATETPSEIELKLTVGADELPRLMRHPLMRSLEPAKTLVSTYFDTRDHELRRAGVTLRVRRAGRERIQTVKVAGERSAGLFAREEWETPIEAGRPSPATLVGTPVEPLLPPDRLRKLRPLFKIEVERASRVFGRGDAEIELSLDQGRATAAGRSAPLIELELELKRGAPETLFAAAREIFDGMPPRLSAGSKFDAGYALLHPRDGPVKAQAARLVRGMTCAQAFQAIVRSCLAHYLGNEPWLRRDGSPADLHQARVALRRLRAAMSLFKRMLADEQSDRLKASARALGAVLGEARDLDVLREQLGEDADPALRAEVERRRQAAYARLSDVLATSSAAGLPFDLAAWAAAGDWLSSEGRKQAALREQPVEAFAAETLAKRHAQVTKHASRLHALEPDARHQVRIEVKKLRYAVEFFEPLAKGGKARRRAQRFLEALRPLQENLGELNDIATQREIAATFPPEAGAAFADTGRKAPVLLKKAEKGAAKLAKAEPFL